MWLLIKFDPRRGLSCLLTAEKNAVFAVDLVKTSHHYLQLTTGGEDSVQWWQSATRD